MATQVSLNSGAVASAGALALQTNGTTAAITLDTSQNATFAGKVTSAGALTLASNGTSTAVTIDTSQNVGIGTTSTSAYRLNVKAAFTSGVAGAYIEAGEFNQSIMVLNHTNASVTSNLFQVQKSGTGVLTLDSSGNLLVGKTSGSSKIDVESSANTIVASAVATNASYTSNVLDVEASRNTTNSSYNFIAAAVQGVAYRFYVRDSGNVVNTNNSYGAISDIKVKENIVDASPKLADLQNVRIVNFNYKNDQIHKQIGVIAQELEQVFPAMVDEAPDRDAEGNDLGTTTKSVKYSVFVPILIKAIQELKAEFDAYKASHP